LSNQRTAVGKIIPRHINYLSLLLGSLFVFVFLSLRGSPVPNGNEQYYFLQFARLFDPSYFANDYFLTKLGYSHYFFNLLIGPFTIIADIELIGWIGRITSLIIVSVLLFYLGKTYAISSVSIFLSMCLWVIYGQSIVGGEYIIGSFEAKVISYIFLLASLLCFLDKRGIYASFLTGLCFLFHPSVGLFYIVAISLTLVFTYRLEKVTFVYIFIIFLTSLPLIVLLLPTLSGNNSISNEAAKTIATIYAKHHLDPFSWPKREMAIVFNMFLFNMLHLKINWNDEKIRFLGFFQIFLFISFIIGIFCRHFEFYSFIRLMPFRLFPTIVLYLFFLHLFNSFSKNQFNLNNKLFSLLCLVALLSLSNPYGKFMDQIRENRILWNNYLKPDDIRKCFIWISNNTDKNVQCILPPWRKDSWYYSKRSQIICLRHYPYDVRYYEWEKRIDAVLGRISNMSLNDIERKYNNLNYEDILRIKRSFEANILVSKSNYIFPLAYSTSTYKVYLLQ
jgi:hypothetical protein